MTEESTLHANDTSRLHNDVLSVNRTIIEAARGALQRNIGGDKKVTNKNVVSAFGIAEPTLYRFLREQNPRGISLKGLCAFAHTMERTPLCIYEGGRLQGAVQYAQLQKAESLIDLRELTAQYVGGAVEQICEQKEIPMDSAKMELLVSDKYKTLVPWTVRFNSFVQAHDLQVRFFPDSLFYSRAHHRPAQLIGESLHRTIAGLESIMEVGSLQDRVDVMREIEDVQQRMEHIYGIGERLLGQVGLYLDSKRKEDD